MMICNMDNLINLCSGFGVFYLPWDRCVYSINALDIQDVLTLMLWFQVLSFSTWLLSTGVFNNSREVFYSCLLWQEFWNSTVRSPVGRWALGLYCWNNTQGSLFFKNKAGSFKSMQLKLNKMNSTQLPRGLYYSNIVNKLWVQSTPGPIHVGPFGKCSLWDDYTSSHSAAARLAAGRLSAFIAEKITRGLYSSKIKQVTSS